MYPGCAQLHTEHHSLHTRGLERKYDFSLTEACKDYDGTWKNGDPDWRPAA
jgi:hypothetical protein